MAITRSRKVEIVSDLRKIAETNTSFLILEYKGSSVQDLRNLKKKVKEVQAANMMVIKNSLAKLVFKGIKGEFLGDVVGQNILVYSNDGIALCNVLKAAQKEFKNISIKKAMIEHHVLSKAQVEEIAQYKSIDGVKAQLLSVFMAPMQYIYNVINEKIKQNEV